ncbi:TniQ family protein [Nocardia amamiensis]|uniref:TniQ family protein n=1 Tax=Nocardia amamiensis TaxID=404578 RepID=A0ABS0D2J4_9NOCA|nr:TniQ family protein [Nocardia amamiensis]
MPRSLDPIPDESLPGYILRLAHRLDLTPARSVMLTMSSTDGLRHACRSSHETMVQLAPATHDQFTTMTQLESSEADALTLGSFAARYPIPPEPTNSKSYGSLFTHRTWWLLTGPT